jgi:hypothetical protein
MLALRKSSSEAILGSLVPLHLVPTSLRRVWLGANLHNFSDVLDEAEPIDHILDSFARKSDKILISLKC